MVITFSLGKIILSMHEIQIKLSDGGLSLYAMAEDVRVVRDALMLVADGGAVRWSLKLDSSEQLETVIDELGICE